MDPGYLMDIKDEEYLVIKNNINKTPEVYKDVYLHTEDNQYLYWKDINNTKILALTLDKSLATNFNLNFFNEEFVKPYYVKSFRNSVMDDKFIKLYG